MTPKAILICGKLCCGKTVYAEKLRAQGRAVLLSVDELMLLVLGSDCGDMHDEYARRVQGYLLRKSLEILRSGTGVILDWGFWQKADRSSAREFYSENGIHCELHYIDIGDEARRQNIAERNRAVSENGAAAYYVDSGLSEKLERLFEPPDKSEIDVLYTYTR